MKHHKFTTVEREELQKNPNISKVLNSNVEYSEEFKQKALYEHKELGKTANQIFKEAGIPDWLNIAGYAKTCIKRWKYQQRHPKITNRGRLASLCNYRAVHIITNKNTFLINKKRINRLYIL